ncbi:hypothetical protein [Rugamonas sp.]|uniref:hypothetical protein n=1 Tax=Rugamonas sp. TaxID=1926287 RepID=UPI0025EB392D|nr:hypothetical protein [Rugamonas sp.]
MFNSTVLEVAVGVVFCFCAVSLIVSSANEAVSSLLNLRGKYLLRSLELLFNEPAGAGLVLALYNHVRIHPAGGGRATAVRQLRQLPAYAEPRQFAIALTEILQDRAGEAGDLRTAIAALPEPQLKQLLTSMYRRAGADQPRFEAELASWFDSSMRRLSAAYKRTMQWWALLFGLLLAVALNIDALHLFKVLWAHPALMNAASAVQLVDAHSALEHLNATTLPLGWEMAPFSYAGGALHAGYSPGQLAQMAAGWLITASSTLFGSPFWFDLLQKISNLRGTGPKVG